MPRISKSKTALPIIAGLVFVLGLFPPLTAEAQRKSRASAPSRAPAAEVTRSPETPTQSLALDAAAARTAKSTGLTLPIAKFMKFSQPIKLRYLNDEFTVFVPIAERLKVNSALLHLQLTNSISLLKERSQLAVRLNGRVMAQITLNPQTPESRVDIRLPGEVLKPGYNRLTFTVAQHYTYKCEDPTAPELWTDIDTVASTLTLNADLLPLAPRLSGMNTLFDAKLWGDPTFTIVTAPPAAMRDDQLQWGALTAQAAALRLNYVPLRIRHETAASSSRYAASTAAFPGLDQERLQYSDSALVGTKAELAQFVSPRILDGVAGSFLGVYPLDADPRRFVLVVSGTTAAEVTQAARALTVLNFPYPDTSSMLVTKIDPPERPNYAGKNIVSEDGIYRFSKFDFKSTTVKGPGGSALVHDEHVESLHIEVVMPPDLFAHEDTNVDLELHFAYGAGLRKDSVINIYLNDRFEKAIALTVEAGVVYHKYRISIPLRSFQAGMNDLRFSPRLVPLITGECQIYNTENLILTVFDDSTLRMPKASHYVAMPSLRLLVKTGFPYTIKSGGAGALVHVASNDSKTIASAWMVLAKLAQRHLRALDQALISFGLPQSQDHDLIVVGSIGRVPPNLLKGAPLEYAKLSRVPYSVAVEEPSGERTTGGPLQWLLPGISRPLERGGADVDPSKPVIMTQVSDLTNSTLTMQYRSPLSSGRTATVFAAANEDVLWQGVAEMIKPELWEDLQGNLVVWSKGVEAVSWQKVGADYHVGTISAPARMEFYFSNYPWFWFIALMALLALLAVLTTRMLNRFRRRNHEKLEEMQRRDKA
ncbi:MAG: cellulose biosynthesis cyclic di-GMP-binding regulatory protein BcsB [Betaproteobacteria bacterium]|nr:cellulose biosynthesis cyclic di-GMP-binding regulatory protein BcsB [Betaproteobacteria bacterium]